MTDNGDLLRNYILTLQPGTWITDPLKRALFIPETRSCISCGSPYTLKTPYELCNPVLRDLCDDCILGPQTPTTTTTTKLDPDPDPDQVVKLSGASAW